jgi:hypothetical protein
MGLLTLVAGGLLLGACARPPEPGPSKEEIWKQIYESRLENLRALDRAFNQLGQEYYKLEIEYKAAGRDDLAAISHERAKAFHEEHLEFQKRVAELERIDGRLRRGDSALDIQANRAAQESEPRYSAPPVTAPVPSAPPESSYRPPSSSGYAAPTRTPTPSPSGLGSSSGSRFNDPIIITDPKLNDR